MGKATRPTIMWTPEVAAWYVANIEKLECWNPEDCLGVEGCGCVGCAFDADLQAVKLLYPFPPELDAFIATA